LNEDTLQRKSKGFMSRQNERKERNREQSYKLKTRFRIEHGMTKE